MAEDIVLATPFTGHLLGIVIAAILIGGLIGTGLKAIEKSLKSNLAVNKPMI